MVVVPAAAAVELLAARARGHRRRHRGRRGARRHEHHARPGRRLLVARPRVRRQRQAGRRRARRGARDVGAGHGHRRLAALRLDQRHERRGRDRRRRRRAARADAARRSTAPRSAACSPGTRSAAARRRSPSGTGSSGSARPRSARSRRRPRRSASGSGAARAGTRRAPSSSGTSRRAGSSSRSRRTSTATPRRCSSPSRPATSCSAAAGSRKVLVTVRAPAAPRERIVTGTIAAAVSGSLQTLHVPWALGFRRYSANLLAHVSLNKKSFTPSDTAPALLTIQAGNLVRDDGLQIQPVARLDVLLYDSQRPVHRHARAAPQPPAGGVQLRDHGPRPVEPRAASRRLRAAAGRVADAATRRRSRAGRRVSFQIE